MLWVQSLRNFQRCDIHTGVGRYLNQQDMDMINEMVHRYVNDRFYSNKQTAREIVRIIIVRACVQTICGCAAQLFRSAENQVCSAPGILRCRFAEDASRDQKSHPQKGADACSAILVPCNTNSCVHGSTGVFEAFREAAALRAVWRPRIRV